MKAGQCHGPTGLARLRWACTTESEAFVTTTTVIRGTVWSWTTDVTSVSVCSTLLASVHALINLV